MDEAIGLKSTKINVIQCFTTTLAEDPVVAAQEAVVLEVQMAPEVVVLAAPVVTEAQEVAAPEVADPEAQAALEVDPEALEAADPVVAVDLEEQIVRVRQKSVSSKTLRVSVMINTLVHYQMARSGLSRSTRKNVQKLKRRINVTLIPGLVVVVANVIAWISLKISI